MPHESPSIDFHEVRALNGRRSEGFEELVCQLAGLEERAAGSEFIRKGKGRDGGLECFVRLADGSEIGWQVKYSWSFDANLIGSLDKSLAAALAKHPKLTVLTVCLPFDLSDARGKAVTQRAAYETWRANRIAEAAKNGRSLEIKLWDAHALGERLTSDDPRLSGRRLYWFGTQHLTADWFAEQFGRVRSNLGRRYTAETNVALPVRRALVGLARNAELLQELADHRSKLLEVTDGLKRTGIMTAEQAETIEAAARSLDAIEDLSADQWPISTWQGKAHTALEVARSLYHAELERQDQTAEDSGRPERSHYSTFRQALEAFNALVDTLEDQPWLVAVGAAVLVTGEAGAGKSHLLADACAYQLQKSRPALLFLGSSLVDTDIWSQLIQQLGLPSYYTRDTFLGALDAAGEAAGCRSLLMIDAINERHGRQIWPDRLGGFLFDAAKYANVAVVFSCRSTYLSQTLPSDLGARSPLELEHTGFSTFDARAFLALRGIMLTEHPFLDVELRNPLFLKTCCDALEQEGKTRFPKGLRGVTAVFSMYREAVSDAIQRRMNLNSRRRITERAIDALAHEIESTQDPYIPVDRAFEIIDEIHEGKGDQDSDLLHQLETEGVISIEPVPADETSDPDLQDHVRFTFERFADHTVARSILDETLVEARLPSPLSPDSPLARACVRGGLPWGVREALAVQLPERTGVELPDALANIPGVMTRSLITPETVRLRAPSSITERTLELLEDSGGVDARWDALVRLSIDSESTFDAYWLHELLKVMKIPERDADWSIFVANYGDDSSNLDNSAAADLIAWARDMQAGEADPNIAQRAAIALTWFLSTSSRRARDTATMGLVNLLTMFPAVADELLELFDGVNDPYVGERLSASLYGAALQGRWRADAIGVIAKRVAMQFFQRGPLPLDLLWRDHLSSLLRYAESRGCTDFIPGGVNTHPPFSSNWPLEPVPDAQIDTYTRTYRDGVILSDEIVSSTGHHGDFGSYVIKYAVGGWSPAGREETTPPSSADLYSLWRAEFDSYSTPEMVHLFEEMDALRAKGPEWAYASGDSAKEHQRIEEKFRDTLGTERFERYRVMARHWRPSAGWGENPAEFNVAWAQRWVCMRAHDLGWSEGLHGQYDRSCGHGRTSHKSERIGKKYQWIALHELMSRISDNCAASKGDWTAQYRETVRRLRKIDPSRLMEESHDWGWASFNEPTFWMPVIPRKAAMDRDAAWEWLDADRELLDGACFVDLKSDHNGQKWLPLGGFQHFRLRGTTQETERILRETWLRLECLIVHIGDESVGLDQLKDALFLGNHDLGLNQDGQDDWYLGEYDWRNDRDPQWSRWWGNRQHRRAGVEAAATTVQFLQEAGSYDHSLKQNFSVRLPAPWVIQALGLRLADGRTVRYVDSQGTTRAFDPSAEQAGPSTVLVARTEFFRMCQAKGFRPIWVLAGAKEVYDKQDSDLFGRRNFTNVYTVDGDTVVCRLKKAEYEGDSPSR
ncbi:ATP-binding protein [Mesorhizobium sp. M0500]|uniref:ATP-binding protein n=1 Tax=Mesorhizobium sp. M0500 TaxID=2956953 RepID=UPI0033399AD0